MKSTPVTTQNTAKNVIFILLAGAPSHTDTFDLKVHQRHHARHVQSRTPSTACCFPPA